MGRPTGTPGTLIKAGSSNKRRRDGPDQRKNSKNPIGRYRPAPWSGQWKVRRGPPPHCPARSLRAGIGHASQEQDSAGFDVSNQEDERPVDRHLNGLFAGT